MKRSAFTLIELLVVVAIIVALLSILLPSMNKAIGLAEDTQCRSNLRQTSLAFFTFAAEHHRSLPGGWHGYSQGAEPWQKPWMGMEVDPANKMGWTHTGTLRDYVGGAGAAEELYRCPSQPVAPLGSGQGSNGVFDFAGLLVFAGAKFTAIPNTSQVIIPVTGQTLNRPTPIIWEEDPVAHINFSNIEFDAGNIDRLSRVHNGNGNYAGIGGEVVQLDLSGGTGPTCWDWNTRAPSGTYYDLSNGTYGAWNGW